MGDGRHILVAVRNTGPVIVPEKLARFFVPFFTTKSEGMGPGSVDMSIHRGKSSWTIVGGIR